MYVSDSGNSLVKYNGCASHRPSLSSRLQSLVTFHLRCMGSDIITYNNESHFQNLKDLKLFGRIVYSQLPSTCSKNIYFDQYQKLKKNLIEFIGIRNILSKWCKQKGAIALNSKNYSAFCDFKTFFSCNYVRTSAWYVDTIKLNEDPNFSLVCLLGHIRAVKILLNKSPKLVEQSLTPKGSSALDCAVMSENIDLIRLIYQHGGRPRKTLSYSYAVESGNWGLVHFLIKECPEIKIDLEEEKGLFPIAALSENPEILTFLLKQGLNINEVTSVQKETALHLACRYHLNGIVAFLLDHQAQVNIKNARNQTPLGTALMANNWEAIRMLIAKHKQELLEDESYIPCLLSACRNGKLDLVKLMMDERIARDLKDGDGRPLLHVATQSGNEELVEFLIQAKFQVQQRDVQGATALHTTACGNNKKLAELLLQAGADVNGEDRYGTVPLFYASTEMRKFLISKGADINHQRSTDGFTGLILGLCQGVREEAILEWLEDGADCTLIAKNQMSALAYALAFDYQKVTQAMIDKGAESSLTTKNMTIALCLALERGNIEGAKNLVRRGANANDMSYGTCPALITIINPHLSEETKIAMLTFLFEAGANINTSFNAIQPGPILLLVSTGANLSKVSTFLINRGINVQTDTKSNSLINALANRDIPLAELLLKHGALIDPKIQIESGGVSPLIAAIISGEVDLTLELIERGANPNIHDNRLSVLHYACLYGLVEVVRKLLAKKAEIYFDSQVTTPLHIALSNPNNIFESFANLQNKKLFKRVNPIPQENQCAIIELLLNAQKSLVNETKGCKYPPLIEAFIEKAPLAAIDLLLKHGADPTPLHQYSEEILRSIFSSGRLDLYECFLQHGGKDEIPSYDKLALMREEAHVPLLKEVLKKQTIDLFSLPQIELQDLLPYNDLTLQAYKPYDRGFFTILKSLKRMAHSFAINGTFTLSKEKSFDLTGAKQYLSIELARIFEYYLLKHRDSLLKEYTQEDILSMLSAILPLKKKVSGEEMESRLKEGRPIVFSSGITTHYIGLVCFRHPVTMKTHVLLENRGGGTEYIGLSEFAFFPKQPLENAFDLLNAHYNLLTDVKEHKLCVLRTIEDFKNLWESVGADYQHATPLMEQYPQQLGTCHHNNTVGSFGGLFYAQAILAGLPKKQALEIMGRRYKEFTSYERNVTLREGLQDHNVDQFPEEFEFPMFFFRNLYDKVLNDSRIEKSLVKKLKKTIKAFALREMSQS